MGIKQELGSNIKKIRKKYHLTQEQFSELINIAPRTLYGIENGRNFVTAETLDKIIQVLNISSADLFTGEDEVTFEQMVLQIKSKIDALQNEPEKLSLLYKIFKHLINN